MGCILTVSPEFEPLVLQDSFVSLTSLQVVRVRLSDQDFFAPVWYA